LDRGEVIQQERRVGERVIEPRERAANLEALALERGRRVDYSDNAPRLGVRSSDTGKTKRVRVDGWHRKRQRRKWRAYSCGPVWLWLLEPLVSPLSRRVLFVVAAAIRFATRGDRPLRIALRLMWSYFLLLLGLFPPLGGIAAV